MAGKTIKFEKSMPDNKIWWTENPGTGEIRFSFDKNKTYSVWDDYPYNMTIEEVTAFDRENPQWARFFECRRKNRRYGIINGKR